ncbi:hypothetical protein SISSUDRAFT_1069656 [Sistotremastrum suecicum HHB10207 ss-3]|uniref:CID domain-containing protein n=1 Tax=Sistotremastrum suecicum HHB10207 ss-3 TaxID=1314776 RepID=A0A166GPL5_9AGAM|nr:hypothetical protein SISSUDRAFT_1069656 [Sistotremastrum suecicum HHB10207 ss-3]
MDGFEVRMQFVSHLRHLNASQQSIRGTVGYALKYFSRHGEDLWDCLLEECQNGTLNSRINILYLLDTLCETCLSTFSDYPSSSSSSSKKPYYLEFVGRDLPKIVNYVVPAGRQGLPNLMSTTQILENWRTKRILDATLIDSVIDDLSRQKASVCEGEQGPSDDPSAVLPQAEVLKRMDQDRERHKRLRERRWVQPIPRSSAQPQIPTLASFLPLPEDSSDPTSAPSTSASTSASTSTKPLNNSTSSNISGVALEDVEFENAWETTSDWNEDDEEDVQEETRLCFPDDAFLNHKTGRWSAPEVADLG